VLLSCEILIKTRERERERDRKTDKALNNESPVGRILP
jgi:hypothetical protein